MRSPESNSTQCNSTARTTGKIGLEKEVGDDKKETGGWALARREKVDPRLSHLLAGLSEPHRSE